MSVSLVMSLFVSLAARVAIQQPVQSPRICTAASTFFKQQSWSSSQNRAELCLPFPAQGLGGCAGWQGRSERSVWITRSQASAAMPGPGQEASRQNGCGCALGSAPGTAPCQGSFVSAEKPQLPSLHQGLDPLVWSCVSVRESSPGVHRASQEQGNARGCVQGVAACEGKGSQKLLPSVLPFPDSFYNI